MDAQQTSVGSSVDEDDSSVLQSLHDDSAIESDSEDVCNESYEVPLMLFCHIMSQSTVYFMHFFNVTRHKAKLLKV